MDLTEITARIESIADLDLAGLDQLAADIAEARTAARNPDDGVVNFETLTALADGLSAVNTRRDELAATEAAGLAELERLDAEFEAAATRGTDDEAPDLTVLEGLEDDVLTALAEFTTEDVTFFGELASIEGLTVEDITALTATPDADTDDTPEARAAAAPATLRLPPTGRSTSQAIDAPAEPVRAARIYNGRLDDRGLTNDEAMARMRRVAGALKRGDEQHVITLDVNPDIPRIPSGKNPDIDGLIDGELARLREHRAASAAGSVTRQAAGTLCAPARVIYEATVLGTDDMPMGSLFPGLAESEADAMKTLSYTLGLDVSDFSAIDPATGAGVDTATVAQNADGSNYPKTSARVACPTFVDCDQQAVWLYLNYDNLNALAWPEFAAASDKGGRNVLAAYMEELLLQRWWDLAVVQNNDLVTGGAGTQAYNAEHGFLYRILSIVAADRADTRDYATPYVVAAPKHLEAQLVTEVAAQFNLGGNMTGEQARREVLTRYGITVEWYLDRFGITADANETGGGSPTKMPQVRGSGDVPSFPCQARIGIARDDAFIYRRGAELNLGTFRTETDVEENEYGTFYESWQRLCPRNKHFFVADVNVDPTALVAGQAVAGVASAFPSLCNVEGS